MIFIDCGTALITYLLSHTLVSGVPVESNPIPAADGLLTVPFLDVPLDTSSTSVDPLKSTVVTNITSLLENQTSLDSSRLKNHHTKSNHTALRLHAVNNTKQFGKGIEEHFVDTAVAVKQAVIRPIQTGKALGELVLHPVEIGGALADRIKDVCKEDKAKCAGEATGFVLTAGLTEGIGAAAEAAEVGVRVGQVAHGVELGAHSAEATHVVSQIRDGDVDSSSKDKNSKHGR
jgi:hypothetical protein